MTAKRNGSGGNGNGLRRTKRLRVASVSRPAGRSRVTRAADRVAATRDRCSRRRRRRGRHRGAEKTEKRVLVSIAPPQRWEKRRSSSWGKVCGSSARGAAKVGVVSRVRADRSPTVDRLEAAPEDAVVVGQSVVVEPVAAVAETLAVPPADRLELGRAQRLGDQHVVVDRGDVAVGGAQRGGVGAGAEDGAAGADRAGGSADAHPLAVALQAGGGRALVDPHAGAPRRLEEPDRESFAGSRTPPASFSQTPLRYSGESTSARIAAASAKTSTS